MLLRILPEPAHTDTSAPYYEELLGWLVLFINRNGWYASWEYNKSADTYRIIADVPHVCELTLLHLLATIPIVRHSLLQKGVYDVYVTTYSPPLELVGTMVHEPESVGQLNQPIPADILEGAAILARQGFLVMGFMIYEGRCIILLQ